MVHDVVPKKDMFCKERKISFLAGASFLWSVCCLFLVGLAIVCHAEDMFQAELICTYVHVFVCTLIFTIVHAMVFSNRVHDCTNIFFGLSRFRTPGLAHDLFCWSRVRFPDLAA